MLSQKKLKIAGLVVLYNPPNDIIENIKTYINQLDVLLVIDNSEKANEEIVNSIKNFSKVIYVANNKNLGLAAAINYGINFAKQREYDWLLTMDHDSEFTTGSLEMMLGYIYNNDITQIGVVAPLQLNKFENIAERPSNIEQILTSMNSGNLLNLAVNSKIGPFNEVLKNDYIDHDYCLRLNFLGYKVIRINKAVLNHNLGRITKHFNFLVTNHSAERRYYITRNRLYLMSKYKKTFPIFYKENRRALIREFIFIVLFENNKIKKFKSILKGISDYKLL